MMAIPFMSCSARLTIYMLIIPAFFPVHWRGLMFILLYGIGIVLAVVLVKLLRVTVLSGESTPFVMELPPYRMPTLRSILNDMIQKSYLYLQKAGTVILALSIVLWTATSYPKKSHYEIDASPRAAAMSPAQLGAARAAEDLSYSVAGRIGRAMEPAFRPLGFDWQICTALIGALAAKEVFVAQLGIVYSLGDGEQSVADLRNILKAHYRPLVGFCIMLFCLITSPCMATMAVMRRESNSWKWPLLQFGGLTVLAWLLALAVFQVGSLLHLGG
jgi:ferrous iron transport protein B